MATNPRYQNGNLRRKMRARLKALGLPCHICGKPIHYDEPSDGKHPLSFVIDEIIPVGKEIVTLSYGLEGLNEGFKSEFLKRFLDKREELKRLMKFI